MALQPSFPAREVERLREERLNDLKQTMADARRRVDRLFPSVVYADGAAYARLMAGSEATVPGLDRDVLVARHAALLRPEACTVIVCGDLDGLPVEDIVASSITAWPEQPGTGSETSATSEPGGPAPDSPRAGDGSWSSTDPVRHSRRSASATSGPPGASTDFHALAVMNALLGGLFNSRLNRLLREERGYTYGVHSDFDMRRAAGPFSVRCAVETEVTAPAIADIMSELRPHPRDVGRPG